MDIINVLTIAAKAAGVSPAILIAICTTETGLKNIHNMSDGGSPSLGICQIKTNTARSLGVLLEDKKMAKWTEKDLKDVTNNAKAAALYLKWQLERYDNNLCGAIAAYNSGTLFESKKEPGHPRNYRYVKEVTANMGLSEEAVSKNCKKYFKK